MEKNKHKKSFYFLLFRFLVQGVSLNLPVFLQQKENAVKGLTAGVAYLFKSNKVNTKWRSQGLCSIGFF